MPSSSDRGFMLFDRETPPNRPVKERIRDFEEFAGSFPREQIERQAVRCMDCSVPFCHDACPLGNLVPDIHRAIKRGDWRSAVELIHLTDNFPEFTGRVCPALCEASCVLEIGGNPVTTAFLEKSITERAWQEGWIEPAPPCKRTDRKVAIVGSGPAGLAAAQQLNRAGHTVTVFERADGPGGLLTYGIPNFKLPKPVVRRRIDQMTAEGVEFRCGVWIGRNAPVSLLDGYDAVLLTIGSTQSRDLDIPGRELDGIHMATNFLSQQIRRSAGKTIEGSEITAKDKNVVVIGGGDTGADCVGTAIRQGAKRVYSLELLPRPPLHRDTTMLWPMWPMILRTSTSHEEGGTREWSVLTKGFSGSAGRVSRLHGVQLQWHEQTGTGRRAMAEIPGTEFTIDCDLVLLALGFLHPEHDTIIADLTLELGPAGTIKTDDAYRTSREHVFAAGDARRGQSLVVWAILEGREAARCINVALMGRTKSPSACTATAPV